MGIQLSVAARNARLDAIEVEAGASAKLAIFTGSQPTNCAAANNGTKIAQFDLAADWAAAASNGSKNFNNTPISTVGINGGGSCGHFRLFKNDGTTCVLQGSVSTTGGGGDLVVDNVSLANGQAINVVGLTVNDNNA